MGPLDRMILTTVRCTACGGGIDECRCWARCYCGWSYERGGRCPNPDHMGLRVLDGTTDPEAIALLAASWTPEVPEGCPDPGVYQLRWRRPPKGRAKRGRLYASTGQAFGAFLMRVFAKLAEPLVRP